MSNETIYALSTPKGTSGVAVIRISGDNSLNILKSLSGINILEPRKMYVSNISYNNNLLDKSMLVYFKAPKSYTGEDMAELHLHGGFAVISSVIEAIKSFDKTRMATAGEFTKRALYNQKLDIISAEAVMEVINAQAPKQQEQALKHMLGSSSNKLDDWRTKLIKAISLIEANIDFGDEDLPDNTKEDALKIIKSIENDMEISLNANKSAKIVQNGVKIALIGEPNVGKSTLFNLLSNEDRAIVSDIAGTTRDYIEVALNISGYMAILIDTAGIHETNNVVEAEGIKRTIKKSKEADLIIPIVSADKLSNVLEILSDIDEKKIKFIIVNKIDKVSKDKIKKIEEQITALNKKSIFISCKNEEGIESLFKELELYIKDLCYKSELAISTSLRHEENLKQCIMYLKNAQIEQDIVLIAQSLRFAINSIGKIVGNVNVEEVLDAIFKDFCIGK